MLKRDNFGIVCQHDNTPDYMDGGDSACRTGLLALCGSEQDMDLLSLFESSGLMVRHPKQAPWNNFRNSTRDQLVAYAAGCARAGKGSIVLRLLEAHKARGWRCQNTEADYPGTAKKWPNGADWLAPDHRLHLKLCAGLEYMGTSLEYAWLRMSIFWSTKIQPEHELNQILCQCLVAGTPYVHMLCEGHPNWRKNLMDYWAGWRDQREIAEMLISETEKRLWL